MSILNKTNSGWEEEFDDLNWNTDKGVMTKARVINQSTGETVGQITMPVTKEMIKSFISTQIQKAVNEVLDSVEKESKSFLWIEKMDDILRAVSLNRWPQDELRNSLSTLRNKLNIEKEK